MVPSIVLIALFAEWSTRRKTTSSAWKKVFSLLQDSIGLGRVKRCNSKKCIGYVKPDVVFYGETINNDYINQWKEDTKDCDLVIVIGTSLNVEPVATFINSLPLRTLRLLINKEIVEPFKSHFDYEKMEDIYISNYKNVRDVIYIGDCDDGVIELAKLLHWEHDLLNMVSHWIQSHSSCDCKSLEKKLRHLQTECNNSPTSSIFDL